MIYAGQELPCSAVGTALMRYALHLRTLGLAQNIPHISLNTTAFIGCLLAQKKPQRILEIGTATGFSSIAMLSFLLDSDVFIDTIEISRPSHQIAQSNFYHAGVHHRIKAHFGDAVDILPTFQSKNYDFIFIDAQKKQTWAFFELAVMCGQAGATILIDNVRKFQHKMADGVKKIQDSFPCVMHQTDADDALLEVFLDEQALRKFATDHK